MVVQSWELSGTLIKLSCHVALGVSGFPLSTMSCFLLFLRQHVGHTEDLLGVADAQLVHDTVL